MNYYARLMNIIPEGMGTHRVDCPKCGGKGTLAVTVTATTTLYFCHRAECHLKGRAGSHAPPETNNMKPPAADWSPRMNFLRGYTRHTIRDNHGVNQGWLFRANDKGVRPKARMEMRPSWCGLHFPSYLQGNWVLLVEDMASAVIMDPYFPTVALLGTYLSREKADYLLKCGVKHVILALDADASDKALAMRKEWNMIEHVVLLKEDIKDMKLKQVEDLSLELYDISDSARKCG